MTTTEPPQYFFLVYRTKLAQLSGGVAFLFSDGTWHEARYLRRRILRDAEEITTAEARMLFPKAFPRYYLLYNGTTLLARVQGLFRAEFFKGGAWHEANHIA